MEDYHPASWNDPYGRLFWREGRLFRGMYGERSAFFKTLLQTPLFIKHMSQRDVVPTWISSGEGEFPLTVEHEVLPFVTYPAEWCSAQLKAAALMLLRLEADFRREGYTVLDANPWNVLFSNNKPMLVDIGCIYPLDDPNIWPGRREIEEFYLNPLLLFERGLHRHARRLLNDPWIGITEQDAKNLGITSNLKRPRNTSASPESQIQEVRDNVQTINVLKERTWWKGYYDNNYPDFKDSTNWTAKHHALDKALTTRKPRTVLDIGSNRGWYSQLAARKGAAVIAADSDENSVNQLFDDLQLSNANILPMFMDVRLPEGAQGPAWSWFPSAERRLKVDMVLALAIVHHLTFQWHLSFDQIVASMAVFTREWLVVEFVGPDDDVVQSIGQDKFRLAKYTRAGFEEAIRKLFNIEEILSSDAGGLDDRPPDRSIYICQKRTA